MNTEELFYRHCDMYSDKAQHKALALELKALPFNQACRTLITLNTLYEDTGTNINDLLEEIDKA